MATIEEKVIEWKSELSSVLNGCNTKITEKGGTPAITLMDLADSIGTIIFGGSASFPSGVIALEAGEFTPEEDITSKYEITYNLEIAPTFFYVIASGEFNAEVNRGYQLFQTCVSKSYTAKDTSYYGLYFIRCAKDDGSMYNISTSLSSANITKTKASVMASSTYALKAGVTYKWIAVAIDV